MRQSLTYGVQVLTQPLGETHGVGRAFHSEACFAVRRSEFESWVLFCSYSGWAEMGEHLEDDPQRRGSWVVSKHCRNLQAWPKLLCLLPRLEVVSGEYVPGNTLMRCHMDMIMNLKLLLNHNLTCGLSLVSQRVEKNAHLELLRW